DIVAWRMNGAHVPVFSAKPWDYLPVNNPEHSFSDYAFDVIVKDGAAWVVGASDGKHEHPLDDMRGLIVRMDVETGAPLDPVIVAPRLGSWRHSQYLSAAP